MNVLYSPQHLGCVIPPQADAGWIGEAPAGPVLPGRGLGAGVENEFTQRNTVFMTWNLMHLASMIKSAGGIPAHGNSRRAWDAGARFRPSVPARQLSRVRTAGDPRRKTSVEA